MAARDSENLIRLTKHDFSEEALQSVLQVLRSGNLVQGANVQKLEAVLANYLEVEHSILVSSGTAALHLALVALGIGPGDEVIVPAFTFPATSNVVELVGASSIIVDIGLDDFCINVADIPAKISKRSKAIIPVHEFGMPCDVAALMQISQENELAVIEDAACALGAQFGDRKVGVFGSIGCFSLHPRKALTTGEGGLITTDRADLADLLRTLRNHGMVPKDGGVDFIRAGFNYRLTDFQAALGISQVGDLENQIRRRLEIAKIFDQELAAVSWLQLPKNFSHRRNVYQSYHVLCAPEVNRSKIISALRSDGIETNIGAHALACQSYYQRRYGLKPEDFPNAYRAYTHGLVLPIGAHMNDADVEYVISKIRSLEV